MTQAAARPWFKPDGPRYEKPPTVRELLGMPPPNDHANDHDAPTRRPKVRDQYKLADFIPAGFWEMSEVDQLHALAVAMVRADRCPAVREILAGARLEIRQQWAYRPKLKLLSDTTRVAAREVTRRRPA